MIQNYLLITWRNIRRHTGYSLINIIGLAIGMTAALLIILNVADELSFEQHHLNKDRIFRVAATLSYHGREDDLAATMNPLGPVLKTEYPEVLESVRLNLQDQVLLTREDMAFTENGFFFADSGVFRIFTFPMLAGDPETALTDPYTMVITESMAQKYFGRGDVIGETLQYENRLDFQITGVMADVTGNTQLDCQFLASYSTLESTRPDMTWQCGSLSSTYTYVLLADSADPTEIEQQIPDYIKRNVSPELAELFSFTLQPLTRIYLYSNRIGELEPNGNITMVVLFSALAALILIIACINFMNLSTARSFHRAKEVGIRKVMGANRRRLIRQFLTESIVLTMIALAVSLILFECTIPAFSAFLQKDFQVLKLSGPLLFLTVAVTGLVTGTFAGSYPALYLSRFQPALILKGSTGSGKSQTLVRRLLVVFQFTVSVVLIISTFVVHSQLRFVENMDLGFNDQNLVLMSLDRPDLGAQADVFKQELAKHPEILHVTSANTVPGSGALTKTVPLVEGHEGNGDLPLTITIGCDWDYVRTLGLRIMEGRDFDMLRSSDITEAVIINETARKTYGWETAVGKKIEIPGEEDTTVFSGQVIGVVEDFHLRSLRDVVEPVIIMLNSDRIRSTAVRMAPHQVPEALAVIEEAWSKVFPKDKPDIEFIDEVLHFGFQADENLRLVFLIFSGLAVFIASLGLLGLASFAAEQRTREIGVRKVLGAQTGSIIRMLTADFIKLVGAAGVIAIPLAHYVMNRWLDNFPYHTSMKFWMFASAVTIALIIALVTVSFQAIRAAAVNPVQSLKHE